MYEVSTQLIKLWFEELIKSLQICVNNSFSEGKFPSYLKSDKILFKIWIILCSESVEKMISVIADLFLFLFFYYTVT